MTEMLPEERDLDIKTCGAAGEKVCIGFVRMDGEVAAKYAQDKRSAIVECNNCEVGAVFSGSRRAVEALAQTYNGMAREYLREGTMDDDQGFMLQIYLNHPEAV